MRVRNKILACVLSASMLFASVIPMNASAAEISVGSLDFARNGLEVNYLREPIGVDDQQPTFSWMLTSDGYDKQQSAYRIVVSSAREKAERHQGDVWDSGKVEGEDNYDVVYEGTELKSRTKYYWSVQVWDEDGRETGWSEVSFFETGIMSQEEWKGEWIGINDTDMDFSGANWIWRRDGADFAGTPEGTQYFRKGFRTNSDKDITSVYVGLTADDEYEFYVNGQLVGNNSGVDSWKNGKLFDVTQLVSTDKENIVAVSAYNSSRGYAGLLAKIEVTYSDGSKDTVVSDASWKLSKTEEAGWYAVDYNDSGWTIPDQMEKYGNSPWGSGVSPNAENAFAATVVRKEFEAKKEIAGAHAYVSGLGFFEMKINGRLPDDTLMNVANTQYTQTASYRAFDVTDLVKQGKNAIGVELGNNFYNETCSVWNWQDAAWRDAPKLRMELKLDYTDGTSESITTDGTWKATKEGPITTNSIYYGETYDARKELVDEQNVPYAEAQYDETGWGTAEIMEAPAGKLKAQIMEPMRRTEEKKPESIQKLDNGSYVITAPHMMSGWIKLVIRGADAGDKVTITYGEKRGSDGQVQKLGGKDGVNAGWWPKAYNQQDNYICKGQAVETFEPKFSYKGYHYVQIDNYPGELTMDDVTCYRISNDMETTGEFDSSSELVNDLHFMMVNTMNNNMQGKPTDTPVWEKNGWLGDANVGLETMTYNYGFANMLTHFTEIMEDCQKDFNNVPNMVPTQGWGNDNTVTWNSIFVFGVDQMWDTYGNESYIAEQYDAMRKLALKDIEESKKYGWTWSDGQLADWVSPMGYGEAQQNLPYDEGTSEGSGIVGTGMTYRLLETMAGLADKLGKTEDAAEYRAAMEKIYTAFNEKFYNREKQIYETTTWDGGDKKQYRTKYRQTSQLIPLAFDMVPEEYKQAVLINLVKDIKDKGYHLDTGCVGTKFILPVLADNGYEDVAYRILLQESYPSWGFMLKNEQVSSGASLWEMWETTSRSLGHYFLGTYDEWLYKGIAGIRDMKDGYKTVTIEPTLSTRMASADSNEAFAAGSVKTVRGDVTSRWSLDISTNRAVFDINVPVGTTAKILIPGGNAADITAGGNRISTEMQGIHKIYGEDGKIAIEAGSGTYKFETTVVPDELEKVELQKEILQAEGLNELDYLKPAWEAYQTKVSSAKAALTNPETSQENIDKAVVSLQDAKRVLDENINVSRQALKDVIAKQEKINYVEYAYENVAAYERAYQDAVELAEDRDAKNDALDKAAEDLQKAESILEEGSRFTNLAKGKAVSASSTHEDAYWGWGKDFVADGDRKNQKDKDSEYAGYSSNLGNKETDHEEWVSIDLRKRQEVNAVTFYGATQSPDRPGTCYGFPKSFDIQVSRDGKTWTTVHSEDNYPIPSYGPVTFAFDKVEARYVRLFARHLNQKATDNNFYYLQLSEFEIYHSLNTTANVTVEEITGPASKTAYGSFDLTPGTIRVEGQRVAGIWTLEDQNGNEMEFNKAPAGSYTAKLTFTAPTIFTFDKILQRDNVTVEDNGRDLVYRFPVEIVKADQADVSYEDTFVFDVGGQGQIDLGKVLKKYGPLDGLLLGQPADKDHVLTGEVKLEDGILTFQVNAVNSKDLTATIPVTVKAQNFKDFTLEVKVVLTDKIAVEIACEALDALYTGREYRGLGTPSAVVKESQEAYSGGFDIVYNTENGRAPVDAGEYTVTITPSDSNYAGSLTKTFKISHKVIVFDQLFAQAGNSDLKWDEKTEIIDVSATDRDGETVNMDRVVLTYTTDNAKVAVVDTKGVVTALNAGKANIIVRATADGSRIDCKVPVTVSELQPESPAIAGKSTTMVVLNRVNGYEYAVEGEDGSLKFSDRVLFENLKPGKTYKFYQRFKATATHDAGTTSEALIIKTDQRVSVESVQLDKTVLVLEKGQTETLAAKILPANATDPSYTFESSDPKVASVNRDGVVKANGSGSAVITVKAADGKTAVCTVTVKAGETPGKPAQIQPKSVGLNVSKQTMGIRETAVLKAQVQPSNASDKKVIYKSSNSKVVSVSTSGKLTAKKKGTASITVTTANGKKATCKVTVKAAPKSLKLNAKSKTLKIKKTYKLKAKLSKGSAGKVTYRSSNSRVAKVDSRGKITALRKGKTTITAKTYNGKKAAVRITVRK